MKKWESYEEVATYLLDKFASDFGLERFEGKQTIQGQRSGTEWEIDAKGVRKGNEGGIVVSPLGLQEGAEKIAAAENIQSVELRADSTIYDYFLRFLNNVMVGVHDTIHFKDEVIVIKK